MDTIRLLEVEVEVPIYRATIRIIQDTDTERIQREQGFKDEEINGCDAFVFAEYDNHGSSRINLFFVGKPSYPTIVHEIIHAVNLIYKDRRIDLDLDNDEPQAYLAEWLMEQCIKNLVIK